MPFLEDTTQSRPKVQREEYNQPHNPKLIQTTPVGIAFDPTLSFQGKTFHNCTFSAYKAEYPDSNLLKAQIAQIAQIILKPSESDIRSFRCGSFDKLKHTMHNDRTYNLTNAHDRLKLTAKMKKLTEKPSKERARGIFIHFKLLDISTARGELLSGAMPSDRVVIAFSKLQSTPNLRNTPKISNSKFLRDSSHQEEKELTNLTNCLCPAAPLVFMLINRRLSESNFSHFNIWTSHMTNPRKHFSTRRHKLLVVSFFN